MSIAHTRIRCYLKSLRLSRMRAILMLAGFLTWLPGCAVNAPSCDGRFEPINLPAPASTAGEEIEQEGSSEPDAAHE